MTILFLTLASIATQAAVDHSKNVLIPVPVKADTARPSSFFDFVTLKKNIIEFLSPEHFKYALKLGVSVEDVYDLSLFNFLNDWYRTKYAWGGVSKSGVDCSGFTQQLFKQVYAISLPRMVGDQFARCKPLKREELRPGDLVFFHTTRPGLSHVGFYIGNDQFIHASCNKGVTVDRLSSTYYKKSFRYGGRLIGGVNATGKTSK